jgi:hypothetical protein
MRNRPWLVGIVTFVVVLGVGGLAFAAQEIFTEPPQVETPDFADSAAGNTDIIEEESPSVADDVAAAIEKAEEAEAPAPPTEKSDDDATEPEETEPASEPEETEPASEPKETADEPKAEVFITITTPEDGSRFDEKVIYFAGTATPGATVVSASGYTADIDEEGNWGITLVLSPGGNKAKFIAETNDGRAEAWVTLYYDPPAGESIDVTVNQKYGECSANPPYDKFFGTAPPGTKIIITSEYGSADGYASDKGEFSIKVHFYDAPYGEPFPVTVTAAGREFGFEFTSWAPSLDDLEFTANQKYGSSDANPPYDKFFGTAPPGTSITITSEYGSADGYASEYGEYYIKVHFYDAPYGEPFAVLVSDGEQTFEFSFTSWMTPPEDMPFTANQKYAESTGTWNKYFGTAPAEAAIVVSSDYGTADGVADGTGGWLIEITFAEPPLGEAFPVTVSSGGESITFMFTVLEGSA